ncbi:MAG: hypothetical protein ACC649_02225 [Myxococcota bacterium]
MSHVVIAPVTLAPELVRGWTGEEDALHDAATHVGHYLAEALQEMGVEVTTAHDSAEILAGLPRSADYHRDASLLAREAVARFAADSLLLVELTHWALREMQSDSIKGASVGFRATLHGGVEGRMLWSGELNEHQESILQNRWRSLLYPGRGLRWLRVNELARWGSRRMSREIAASSVHR